MRYFKDFQRGSLGNVRELPLRLWQALRTLEAEIDANQSFIETRAKQARKNREQRRRLKQEHGA